MNEPIQRYFRLGTLQWMSYPQEEPLDALKKIAADDFFTAIETKGYGAQNAQRAAAPAAGGLFGGVVRHQKACPMLIYS